MRPFHLKAALAGRSVVTRNGVPVTEVICFRTDLMYPLRALLSRGGRVVSYTAKGRYNGDGRDSDLDLFMVGE